MYYLIRYGEIALKGLNRPFFENKLASNIRAIAGESLKIKRERGRIIIESEKDISENLKKVFGIVSFSIAYKTDFENMNDFVLNLAKNKKFKTFRITANRINKGYKKNSNEIAKELGSLIVEKLKKKVSLEKYDLNINVELVDGAYVYFDRVECFGGLPVGVEGKVIVLIETKKGIEAAKRVMRRGCDVIPVAFKKTDISEINEYLPNKKEIRIIKEVQEIEELANNKNARALVVEDSLEDIKDYETGLLVLRPLAFD